MIDQALNRKVHPFVFGLYRMTLGLFLFVYFSLFSVRWIEFYGPHGISPIKLRDEWTFIRPSLFSYMHTETGLWLFYAVVMFMVLALILGRLGRWPAIFLWLTLVSIENSNGNNVNAEEFVLVLFAFYAMIMPINETLVFSFRERRFSDSREPVLAWTLIPFFLHIEIIYVLSLPLKPYFEHAWVDGSLVYLAVNNFDMARIPGAYGIMQWDHAIISKLATWASLIVEAIFPIFVWTQRFKVPAILSMVSFQVGIALMLSGVQVFSLSMLVALTLFLPGQATRDLFMEPSWPRLRHWLLPSP